MNAQNQKKYYRKGSISKKIQSLENDGGEKITGGDRAELGQFPFAVSFREAPADFGFLARTIK